MKSYKEKNLEIEYLGKTTDDRELFEELCQIEIEAQASDPVLRQLTNDWYNAAAKHKYSYHFKWMGVPIIQHPSDILVVQELIWDIKPDLIIECGVARGGSLILSASILDIIWRNNDDSKGMVLGVDVDIRRHNRETITTHPLSSRIKLVEGSSIDANIVNEVTNFAKSYQNIMVFLDSNHTHEHVLSELYAYSPLVTKNSYCVVFDTVAEDCDPELVENRPWGKGNSPKSAVEEFLSSNSDFEVDMMPENKALITVNNHGFLKKRS